MWLSYSYIKEKEDLQEFVLQEPKKAAVLRKFYKENIPISPLKYKDLMRLCQYNAISSEYHEEFKKIKHLNSVVEELPDTDEEDVVEEEGNDDCVK